MNGTKRFYEALRTGHIALSTCSEVGCERTRAHDRHDVYDVCAEHAYAREHARQIREAEFADDNGPAYENSMANVGSTAVWGTCVDCTDSSTMRLYHTESYPDGFVCDECQRHDHEDEEFEDACPF